MPNTTTTTTTNKIHSELPYTLALLAAQQRYVNNNGTATANSLPVCPMRRGSSEEMMVASSSQQLVQERPALQESSVEETIDEIIQCPSRRESIRVEEAVIPPRVNSS